MQTNTPADRRRWERQPATIPISLVLKAQNLKVDNSATVLDFSLHGVGVLTKLALFPGEQIEIVAKGEVLDAIRTRVVWVREDRSNHLSFAGLEFLDALATELMLFTTRPSNA
jgi:c-di-GMP-binding flagellar brake protein YcgR